MKAETKTKKQIPEIVVIAFLVALPFILGLFLQNYAEPSSFFSKTSIIPLQDVSSCEQLSEAYEKNNCYVHFAIENLDETICEKINESRQLYRPKGGGYGGSIVTIESDQTIETCIYQVHEKLITLAINSSDYSVCKNYSGCHIRLAIELNDTPHCFSLNQSDKDTCLSEISYKLNISNLCANITGVALQSQCYYHFSQFFPDETICRLIKDGTNASCYYDFALKLKDPFLCSYAGENSPECYYLLAMELNRSMDCGKTGDKSDECFFTIAKRNDDVNLCSSTGRFRMECLFLFARNHLQPALCRGFPDSPKCYFQLADLTNDSALCEKSGDQRAECYRHLAGKLKITQLCFKANLQIDENCIIASSNGSIIYCDYIPSNDSRNQCYRHAAWASGNYSYCLSAGDYRDNCFFTLATTQGRIKECDGAVGSECIKILYNISV